MIGVDKIEDIRKRARGGESIASIARAVGASEPTVRKYARMEDLSPEPPRRREHESEVLAPYEETIDSRLDDDCRNWRKQRHTATRVYVSLRDEEGYTGGYSTVQRYVRRRREEMARERDRRDAEGFLTLRWLPGEVQVDFGEADFRARGVVTRGKYLTVTFPHSNVGLTQVLWGETAECVCQGLRDVFEFVGGAPRRAVFDNATEVGGRVGGEVRASELFRRFAAHYGLDYTFANPYSGNEKGNVENKVGCHRRNLFVPVPSFRDVRTFNRRLLEDCLDLSEGKRHYRLGTPESGLFGEDGEALSPLPPAAFSCARWETRRCSKQGTITVGGVHRYSAGPAYARREVAAYEREWGEAPTDPGPLPEQGGYPVLVGELGPVVGQDRPEDPPRGFLAAQRVHDEPPGRPWSRRRSWMRAAGPAGSARGGAGWSEGRRRRAWTPRRCPSPSRPRARPPGASRTRRGTAWGRARWSFSARRACASCSPPSA